MNEKEDYFRISKTGSIHTLSDRIPFKWKELMIWTSTSFIFLILFFEWFVGIYIAILTLLCYTIYRFTAWIYYSELKIDEKSGKITKLTKLLNRTHKVKLITEKFDPNRFEFTELNRSGKTKFLMNYRTHKSNELMILRTKSDKELIEKYIAEKITVYNNG